MRGLRAIPMPLFAVGMFAAPFLLAWAVTMVRLERGFIAQPAWVTAVEIVVWLYEAAAVVWLLGLRLRPDGRMASRMRDRGRDPAAVLGPAGMAVFYFPTCAAAVLSFVGLPLSHVYGAAAFSAVAMACWAWWYKPRNRSDASRSAVRER